MSGFLNVNGFSPIPSSGNIFNATRTNQPDVGGVLFAAAQPTAVGDTFGTSQVFGSMPPVDTPTLLARIDHNDVMNYAENELDILSSNSTTSNIILEAAGTNSLGQPRSINLQHGDVPNGGIATYSGNTITIDRRQFASDANALGFTEDIQARQFMNVVILDETIGMANRGSAYVNTPAGEAAINALAVSVGVNSGLVQDSEVRNSLGNLATNRAQQAGVGSNQTATTQAENVLNQALSKGLVTQAQVDYARDLLGL